MADAVLIAEDDSTLANGLTRNPRNSGYAVDGVMSGGVCRLRDRQADASGMPPGIGTCFSFTLPVVPALAVVQTE